MSKRDDSNVKGAPDYILGSVRSNFTLVNPDCELYARKSTNGNVCVGGTMKDADGNEWMILTAMPMNPDTKKVYAVDDYDLDKLLKID